MKLFLDSNVLFTAAHKPDGKAALVLEVAGEQTWRVCTCEFAVEEARRNLDIKLPDCLAYFRKLLLRVDCLPTVVEGQCPVALPAKDRPILLSAIRGRSTHLLTGDHRHFGAYMNHPARTGGVIVQTVAMFLDSL